MHTTESWVKLANFKHNGKYDYSNVIYKNWKEKVEIICHEKDKNGIEHGSFYQIPNNHLQGKGCPKCQREKAHNKLSIAPDEYINLCIQKHGNNFDYSKTNYYNMETPITVICKKHGEFITSPITHLHRNGGCKECKKELLVNKQLFSTEKFIEIAKEKYGDFFDYSKSIYNGMKKDIDIICPKHGVFTTKPCNFLNGKSGCPYCRQSTLEIMCFNKLRKKFDNIIKEKHFDWLGLQSLDFYIPEYNVAIECQGIQHFQPRCFDGKNSETAEHNFHIQLERDERKRRLCEENEVKLLYYSNLGIDYPYKVYENLDELLEEIQSS